MGGVTSDEELQLLMEVTAREVDVPRSDSCREERERQGETHTHTLRQDIHPAGSSPSHPPVGSFSGNQMIRQISSFTEPLPKRRPVLDAGVLAAA